MLLLSEWNLDMGINVPKAKLDTDIWWFEIILKFVVRKNYKQDIFLSLSILLSYIEFVFEFATESEKTKPLQYLLILQTTLSISNNFA